VIYVGKLPGESQFALVIDGQTVARFVTQEMPRPEVAGGEKPALSDNALGSAITLLRTLIGQGWLLEDMPKGGLKFWLARDPKYDSPKPDLMGHISP
jgi:hypothetical protein